MRKLARIALAVVGVALVGLLVLVALIWWGNRIPKRPSDISASGIFIENGSVPFKLSTHEDWLDCWRDAHTGLERCRFTGETGILKFEDTFLPYEAQAPDQGADPKIDSNKTGNLWYGAGAEDTRLPVIFLQNGEILLPQSDYQKAKKFVDFWVYGRGNG